MLKRVGTEREQAVEEAVMATVAEQTALREHAVREAVASAQAKPQRRREEAPQERPATDAELADVIAQVLAASPKAGRGTVIAELKARGLTPGKGERLADALAAHKRGDVGGALMCTPAEA
jgi:ribosomal protein L13E